MPDASHVEKLRAGARAWNAWRSQHPDVAPDLNDLDLPVADRQFGLMQGGPVDLSQAELCRAALEHATLIEAELAAAVLIDADLSHARLTQADLRGADLTNANLDHADRSRADLAGASLHGARLRHARNLTQVQLEAAHGDRSTTLPLRLVFPSHWLRGEEGRGAQLEKPIGNARVGQDSDPYRVLGVGRNAALREIRAAYVRLVKELHPDARSHDPLAEERLKTINRAYQDLKDLNRLSAAQKAQSRSPARQNTVFAASFLTSAALALAVLGGLYQAGVFGQRLATAVKDREKAAPSETTIAKSAEPADGPAKLAAADDAAWAAADREASSGALQRYLGSFPDGRRASLANARLAMVAKAEAALQSVPDGQDKAAVADVRTALRSYLDIYPAGPHAADARTKLAAVDAAEAIVTADQAAWTRAQRMASREALLEYLNAYPQGLKREEARSALAAIEATEARERAEQVAWVAAHEAATRLALEQYLAAYPDGPHVDQARRKLDAIAATEARQRADDAAWRLAMEAGTEEALRVYLRSHPDGSNAAAALQKLASLVATDEARDGDDAAWSRAQQHNTRVAIAEYITAHPNGRHVESARERLASLRASDLKTPPASAKAPKQGAPGDAKADRPAASRWPSADEPFVSADGRIR